MPLPSRLSPIARGPARSIVPPGTTNIEVYYRWLSEVCMSYRPWWMVAIQWTLWTVVMAIVMGWLGRSRFRRDATEAGTLRHPRSTLIVGLVCFGLFGALTVASAFTLNMTATWWTTTGFAVFAALS